MAEHTDKILYVRADTYSGWHTQLPDDSILESTIGQISYSQSHHLPGHKYHSQQQDAVGCSVSNNLNLPMPMHFRYPMRWPQNPWSENFDIPSNDSARGGFGSDLELTELKTRYGAANSSYTEAFKHQPAPGQIESLALDLRSPTSGLLS